METSNNTPFNQNPNFGFNSTNNTERPPMPNNNLVLSIVGTLIGGFTLNFCCIGFFVGIASIILSVLVNSKYKSNDFEGAAKLAKISKILAFVAIGLGAIGLIIFIFTLISGGLAAAIDSYKN